MTMDEKATAAKLSIAKHKNTVKAALDKASAGAKKDAALQHYRAAEKAYMAKHDADTSKKQVAAANALS